MQAIGEKEEDSNTGVKLCQFLRGFQGLTSSKLTLCVQSCVHGCLLIKILLQIASGI